jgi:hypothetical protein
MYVRLYHTHKHTNTYTHTLTHTYTLSNTYTQAIGNIPYDWASLLQGVRHVYVLGTGIKHLRVGEGVGFLLFPENG